MKFALSKTLNPLKVMLSTAVLCANVFGAEEEKGGDDQSHLMQLRSDDTTINETITEPNITEEAFQRAELSFQEFKRLADTSTLDEESLIELFWNSSTAQSLLFGYCADIWLDGLKAILKNYPASLNMLADIQFWCRGDISPYNILDYLKYYKQYETLQFLLDHQFENTLNGYDITHIKFGLAIHQKNNEAILSYLENGYTASNEDLWESIENGLPELLMTELLSDDLQVINRSYEKCTEHNCPFIEARSPQYQCEYLPRPLLKQQPSFHKTLITESVILNHVELVKLLMASKKVMMNRPLDFFKKSDHTLNRPLDFFKNKELRFYAYRNGWGNFESHACCTNMRYFFYPIHIVVLNENLDIVKLLLKHPDINPNARAGKMHDSNTPLHFAIILGNVEIAEALMSHEKTKLDVINHWKLTPLHLAYKYNNQKMINLLQQRAEQLNINQIYYDPQEIPGILKQEDKVHSTQAQYTDFLNSLKNQDYNSLNDYIKIKSLNPNIFDSETGLTPLMLAAKANDFQALEILLQCDNINLNLQCAEYGQTALIYAIENSSTECITELLSGKYNIDLEVEDNELRFALYYAAALEKNYDTTNLLLDAGANPNHGIIDDANFPVIAGLADNNFEPQDIELVKLLLQHKTNPTDPLFPSYYGIVSVEIFLDDADVEILRPSAEHESESEDENTPPQPKVTCMQVLESARFTKRRGNFLGFVMAYNEVQASQSSGMHKKQATQKILNNDDLVRFITAYL